jgi:hypothetical protein
VATASKMVLTLRWFSDPAATASSLIVALEIALVLVRVDHVAAIIVHANHGRRVAGL